MAKGELITEKNLKKYLEIWKRHWNNSNKQIVYPKTFILDDEAWKLMSIQTLKNNIVKWKKNPDEMYLDVQRDILEFFNKAKSYQEAILNEICLEDGRNINGARFLLKAQHTYSETDNLNIEQKIKADVEVSFADRADEL